MKLAAYSLPLNAYENVGGKVKNFFILLSFLELILINKRSIKEKSQLANLLMC
jgi:hypothetical protein